MGSRSIEKCFEEAEEAGTLSLHGRSLREFPACIDNCDLTDVMRVDISKNRFVDLPHEIPTFFMLEKLDCSHNLLKCITEVSHLHSLTYLNLSHNQLTSLPVHFCSLPIKILKASHNKLTTLPPEIGTMSKLQDLDVSCNELSSIPSTVGDISALRVLNLRRNHLSSLPDELSKLKNLLFLDFSCNKISVIPPAFRLITSLIKLDLKSNPLTSPPSQVCLKGRLHIFKFLSLAAQNQEKRWSMDRDIRRFKRTPSTTSTSNNSLQETEVRSNHVDEDRPTDGPAHDTIDGRPRKGSMQETRSFFERELDKDRDVLIEAEADSQNESNTRKPSIKKLVRGSSEDLDKGRSSPRTRPTLPEKRKDLSLTRTTKPKTTTTSKTTSATTLSSTTSLTRTNSDKNKATTSIPTPRNRSSNSFGKADRPKPVMNNTMSLDRSAARNYGAKIKSYSIAEEKKTGAANDGDFVSRKQQIIQSRQEALKSKQKLEQIKAKSASLNRGSDTHGNSDTASMSSASSNDSSHQNNEKEAMTVFEGISRRTSQGKDKTTRVIKQGASNFTIRRLNESAKEEFELLEKLRNSIEGRLKITLPDDLVSALADGVVLCHLVNHLKKSTIAVIHVPSSGVPKLTMPKCQMNVDAFLEACRKLGVQKHRVCAPSDILEEKCPAKVCTTVDALLGVMTTGSIV